MKRDKYVLNKYMSIGLIFNSITLISNMFDFIPDFVQGLCAGLTITFIFIGIYAERHNISKFRRKKLNFIKRIFLD